MFKKGKLLKGAIAATVAACMLSVAAFAYTGTGVVNVNTYLNVRQSNSSTSAIVGKLYDGAKITVTGSTNGWYELSYNGKNAWVSSQYVLTGNSARIHTVVDTAKSMLGVKYVFDGATPSGGFDCSGLSLYSYAQVGITLPHSAAAQATMGTAVSRANLQPGDLIFFDTDGNGTVTHNGIYIGGGNFIQAESGTVMKVTEASLSNTYWSSVYVTARRFISQ